MNDRERDVLRQAQVALEDLVAACRRIQVRIDSAAGDPSRLNGCSQMLTWQMSNAVGATYAIGAVLSQDQGTESQVAGAQPVKAGGAAPLPEEVLADPAASEWMKAALRDALRRDPVDAANEAEVLARVLDAHARKTLQEALTNSAAVRT